MTAPDLPQELLDGCRFLANRNALLDVLPRDGTVVEVGTQQGIFAREILARNRPARLHLIDVDFSNLKGDVRAAKNVVLHEALSSDALAAFEDAAADWIYIDADHSYRGVVADIRAAAPKLKPGGFLVFNDFGRIVRPGLGVFGVHQAVCEFAAAQRWKVTHFCFNGEALYDVALQKPE